MEMYGLRKMTEDLDDEDFDDEDDGFLINHEDYPGYHEEPQELISDSDTGDCQHRGNGTPCRFYNRQGCTRAECHYSHAPDDKSVRDELYANHLLFLTSDAHISL